MKKNISFLLIVLFVCAGLMSSAQEAPWKAIARGQSDHGLWLVEQHRDTTDRQRVSFYTKDNSLLYNEEVDGARINVNKDRTIKRLNELLAKVAAEWKVTQAIARRQLVLEHFN